MVERIANGMFSERSAIQPPRYGLWRTMGVGIVIYALSLYLAWLVSSVVLQAWYILGDPDSEVVISFFDGPDSPMWLFQPSGCAIVTWQMPRCLRRRRERFWHNSAEFYAIRHFLA